MYKRQPLLPGAIPEFNQFEFSRAMRHQDCVNPLRIYSHIAPYMGGPEKIMNTNGAGDGALAALLHDITANNYHRNNVPNSSKHKCKWLTYSSLAQVCKYANRVSYQVLNQHSPRLTRGLPEREDSLEEAYWDRSVSYTHLIVEDDNPAMRTPLEWRQAIYEEKLAQAREAIIADNNIQTLRRFFDADLDEESIRPI